MARRRRRRRKKEIKIHACVWRDVFFCYRVTTRLDTWFNNAQCVNVWFISTCHSLDQAATIRIEAWKRNLRCKDTAQKPVWLVLQHRVSMAPFLLMSSCRVMETAEGSSNTAYYRWKTLLILVGRRKSTISLHTRLTSDLVVPVEGRSFYSVRWLFIVPSISPNRYGRGEYPELSFILSLRWAPVKEMIFNSNLHVITRCFLRMIAWCICVLGSEEDCAEQVQVLSGVSDANDVDVSGDDSTVAMSQLQAAKQQFHDNDFDRSVEGEHYWTER